MAQFAPWQALPDFLGASEAGARLNLTRQKMLEQAQEHAESLAAESALEHDRLNAQTQARNQQLGQQTAANALRAAALKQAGLLGTQRLQNESDSVTARSALDAAKTDALNRKNGIDANVKNLSVQGAAAYKAAHPDVSNAELMQRFPMLRNADIPESPRAAPRPLKEPPEFTPTMQNLIFKGALGAGGTNYDNAVDTLNKYRGQFATPAAGVASPAPTGDLPPAGDALTSPPVQDVDALPNPPAAAPKTFTDKSGAKFIYTGSAADPTTDKNPDNWQTQPVGQ